MAPVPHEASPQPLLMRLAAVEGFDLGVALRNVGGSELALERVLRTFIRRYRAGDADLCQAEAPDTLARWRASCHSLRGACATVGAASLPRGFGAFEESLRSGADVAQLAPAAQSLNDELMRVVTALAAALGPGAPTS